MVETLALELQDVCYAYLGNWSFKRKPALNNISLQVSRGESFGFLGHNGAGKTTTIKCILDLVRPTSGKIKLFDQNSRETTARTSVGYLPEQPYFYDNLTVHELMALYGTLAGIPASSLQASIAKALDRVRVASRSKSPMRSLSKGLMQRVAMAQAIVAEPKLLILDEPFSGLDPIGRREFRELLIELKHSGTTIFMSSHILGDVEFLCDRVSIMVHGQLRGVYKVGELPSSKATTYELVVSGVGSGSQSIGALAQSCHVRDSSTRYSFGDRAAAESAMKLALENGVAIQSFEAQRPSLEDLFIELVEQPGDGK